MPIYKFDKIKNSLGFTLVELLVVISIIAILSAVGMVIYSGTRIKARDAVRKADLNSISTALEQYKMINGSYPHSANINNGDIWSANTSWTVTNFGLGSFIQNMPKDPLNTDIGDCSSGDSCHLYRYCSYDYAGGGIVGGTYYMLGVNLEEGPDMGAWPEDHPCSLGGSHRYWILNKQ